jgi:hypothetical protein
MTAINNHSLARGTALVFKLTVNDRTYDPDTGALASTERADLTGAAITWTLKDSAGAVVFTKTVGDGIALLSQSGSTLGQATATMTNGDSEELLGVYPFDVWVTHTDGRIEQVVRGAITFFERRAEAVP